MTLGDLIGAIKLGQKQPGKSAVLQKVAEVTKAPNWSVGISTLQKACNGNGVLQPEDKAKLLTNWEEQKQSLLDYISRLILDAGQTATALGIPKADEYKKELLCKAVRMQFAEFFKSDAGIDVDNIIPDVYQKLLENPDAEPIISTPLTPGDAAHDYSKCKHYNMDIYGTIQHEIELQNMGNVPWVNRRLVFVDEKNKVRPTPVELAIPETSKNGIVKFIIELHGRGSEGRSILRWRMVNANNADCFPGEPDKFHIETETAFTPSN